MIMWGCNTGTEGIYRGKVNTPVKAELIFFFFSPSLWCLFSW